MWHVRLIPRGIFQNPLCNYLCNMYHLLSNLGICSILLCCHHLETSICRVRNLPSRWTLQQGAFPISNNVRVIFSPPDFRWIWDTGCDYIVKSRQNNITSVGHCGFIKFDYVIYTLSIIRHTPRQTPMVLLKINGELWLMFEDVTKSRASKIIASQKWGS